MNEALQQALQITISEIHSSKEPIKSQPGKLLLLQPANMLPLTSCWERYASRNACSHRQIVLNEGPV